MIKLQDILQIHLRISEEDIAKLRLHPRTYISAILEERDRIHRNVAVKLKGGTGSFRSIDEKPCFTINSDKFNKGQRFHGLDKFHLNNSVQDYTYLCEVICSELFLQAGVPTPERPMPLLR